MMPLIPFVSDTKEHLELMFTTFKKYGVHYLLPATITLFGEGRADSKTLMLDAIRKHYPHLEHKYKTYFENGSEMPAYYKNAFSKKMKEMLAMYGIPGRITEIYTNQ